MLDTHTTYLLLNKRAAQHCSCVWARVVNIINDVPWLYTLYITCCICVGGGWYGYGCCYLSGVLVSCCVVSLDVL